MEATRAESSGAGPRRQIEEIEEISIAWRVKREKSTAPSEGRILEENSLDARGSYPNLIKVGKPPNEIWIPDPSHVYVTPGKSSPKGVKPRPPERADQGNCRVVRRNLDVGEAARDALGETFAEPVTDVVVMGFRLLEGSGGGDAMVADTVDQVCGVAKMVVDPAAFASSVVDKAVRHCTAQVLAAPLGPIGVGIAFFAGKFAGELTHQVLDGGGDAAGVQGVERAIELADMAVDARLGRLAESDQFREYVSDLLSKPIIAILPGDTPAAPGQGPDHMPGQASDHMAGQSATIRGVLIAYKVDSPAGRYSDEQQEQLRIQQSVDETGVDAEPARPEEAVVSSGGSRAVRVQPAFFPFVCVPEGAVAERRTSTLYQPDTLERENLLLTDGTLIERQIRGGLPGPWDRVSDWAARTDQREARGLPGLCEHELTSQSKAASESARTPVDADLLAAYRALKEWATRNGVQ